MSFRTSNSCTCPSFFSASFLMTKEPIESLA